MSRISLFTLFGLNDTLQAFLYLLVLVLSVSPYFGGTKITSFIEIPHIWGDSKSIDIKIIKRLKVARYVYGPIFGIILIFIAFPFFDKPDSNTPNDSTKLIKSIGVLPLSNFSDPRDDSYSNGITDMLITQLAQVKGLSVISRSSTMYYKNKNIMISDIASKLGVEGILEGSINRDEKGIFISLQLVDKRNWIRWSHYQKISDINVTTDQIIDELTKYIYRNKYSSPLSRSQRISDPDAIQHYMLGRNSLNARTEQDLLNALQHFRKSIEIESDYANAYAGLAETYILLGIYYVYAPESVYPSAEEAANRSIQIDNNLSEGYTALAHIKWLYNWQWMAAEKLYKTAIALGPNNQVAHHFYGWELSLMGRYEESIKELLLAQKLDPLSSIVNCDLAFAFFRANKIELSKRQFDQAREINPTFGMLHAIQGRINLHNREYQRALSEFNEANNTSASIIKPWIAFTYAKMGDNISAINILNELISASNNTFIPAYEIARIYSGLNNKAATLRWLELAIQRKETGLTRLKSEMLMDFFHESPEVLNILQRLNLE